MPLMAVLQVPSIGVTFEMSVSHTFFSLPERMCIKQMYPPWQVPFRVTFCPCFFDRA